MAAAAVILVAPVASSAQTDPADACVRDLGTLDATTTSASGSGIVAVDSSCVSSQRDPGTTSVYYARRHSFALDAAATVSVSVGPGDRSAYLVLIEGSSADGSGTVVGRASGSGRQGSYSDPGRSASLSHLLLQAGTYTIEATTNSSGATRPYSVSVRWDPADACVRDLGTLDATTTSASGSGIVAVDSSCVSSQRDPGTTSVYYARRHSFALDAAATVSVSVGPGDRSAYLVLIEGVQC